MENKRVNAGCVNEVAFEVLKGILWHTRSPMNAEAVKVLYLETLLPAVPGDRFLVASWESLGNRTTEHYVEMLKRAQTVFGNCRIMVTLRNPLTRLPSEYLQNLRGHFVKRNQDYLGFVTHVDIETWFRKRSKSYPQAPLLNYGNGIRAAVDLLGRENVGVFLFEDLCEDPGTYHRSICEFIGIDADIGVAHAEGAHHNRGIGQKQVEYMREVHESVFKRTVHAFRSPEKRRRDLRANAGGPPAKAHLTDQLAKEVSDATRDGHRWLAETFDLPLEKYGYPL